ncbi:MAG: flagellar basal body L-ring protein FlgH [Gammaproteobacteria bacterium]|nr:flagellar basal body L-ring protein FlgH [Gammaproteobacteria bacterium]MCW8988386.1 flagellar basal body L-ring protein FlgH [Gammaproteobacteria bacterium]MCW9030794.1 flagellar basal body L-ring protein FlgH [Gammaproteobacteria bacterium]
MINYKTIIALTSISVMLSGCLKPLNLRPTDADFKPAEQPRLNVKRLDNGSIYQQGMRVGLFEDTTAKYIGDVLTIVLTENTNASATSNTNSSKDNKVDLPGPTLAGQKVTDKNNTEILTNKFSGEREFNGQGTSAMNSSFNGKISVTVADVLPNRNLVVRGEKMMMLNQSDEYVRFIGIVRPQDIEQDNTIKSTRVANVHMAYGGQGVLAAANKMGPLGRFFQSQAWPY